MPAGMAVTVVEKTDKVFHLVLPAPPTDELSDEALDTVAGGVGPTGAQVGRGAAAAACF